MWNPLDGLSTVNVSFMRLHEAAKEPTYGSVEAAGADLYAIEDTWIWAGRVSVIRTGIAIQLPKGFEAQVRPRSGLALKQGLTVVNAPGTVDSDYRGEIKVLMTTVMHDYHVKAGERIAQLVVVPVFRAAFIPAPAFSQTERGVGGFGSTGSH